MLTTRIQFNVTQPHVQAAIILGSVTIFTVCLGFFIKDYLIPILLETRKTKAEKLNAFRNYRMPLIESATALKYRLDEIFKTRAHLLGRNNPTNEFYSYKYISTHYRLCALLAWIYAFKKEASYLHVPSKTLQRNIVSYLDNFAQALADGQRVEMRVAKSYMEQLHIDVIKYKDRIERYSIEIDRLVQEFITKGKKEFLSETSKSNQERYLSAITKLTKEHFQQDVMLTKTNQLDLVKIVSVKVGLIYRDWQNSIGDMMIRQIANTSGRIYDVISYREFENIFFDDDDPRQVWIKRVEQIFADLDVSEHNQQDTRPQNLKQVNLALENLVIALRKCKV